MYRVESHYNRSSLNKVGPFQEILNNRDKPLWFSDRSCQKTINTFGIIYKMGGIQLLNKKRI